eukprot:NODE_4821_length_637_cov_348.374570.p4 GENE.NODE_4821_length_637_cov_348.374570~~NODE_4821_length_637_cov_348.374570.p4  ORF type:complete len:74 (-),score=2.01 NODE_4821_length_637_cov_348.374570:415-606(-)
MGWQPGEGASRERVEIGVITDLPEGTVASGQRFEHSPELTRFCGGEISPSVVFVRCREHVSNP